MAEKLFYTMGEVAEMFDVKASLLRHWETQFPQLRPKRNAKGNRLYTPRDVEMLKQIYLLVKERGMTLDGAKRALRRMKGDTRGVNRDAELMERLQRIRALLVEVREDLKGSPDAVYAAEDVAADAAAGAEVPAGIADALSAERTAGDDGMASPAEDVAAAGDGAGSGSAAPEICASGAGDDAVSAPEIPAAAIAVAEDSAAADSAESTDCAASADGEAAAPAAGGRRQRRRKKGDADHRELFAFYEQSLF